MNDILKYYDSIPRRALQTELRRFTRDSKLYLWEFVGPNWIYTAVRAGKQTALNFGVKEGEVIGYHVPDGGGHVFGGSIGDLQNVFASNPPYPDPFSVNAGIRWPQPV